MFKNLKRDQLSSYSKFQVAVNATRIEDSTLLNSGGFISVLKKGGKATLAAITALMILMVVFVGLITSAPKANAWGVGDLAEGAIKAFCVTGATGLSADDKNSLAPSPAPKGQNPTMFEKYGMSGANYTLWSGFYDVEDSISGNNYRGIATSTSIITATGGNSKDSGLSKWESELEGNQSGLNNIKQECIPGQSGLNSVTNTFANGILTVSKYAVWFGNISYETASNVSTSLYSYLEEPLTKIAKTLWSGLFFAYLSPIVMISALWLFYQGAILRKVTSFYQSLIYMVAVIVAAGVSYGNPLSLSVGITNLTTNISTGLTSKLSSLSSDTTGLCDATGKNASIRKFQCNNYYSNVYTPFVTGQFGKSPAELTAQKEDNFASYIGTTKTNSKFDLPTLNETNGNQIKINKVSLGNHIPSQQNFALYYIDHRSNWDNASYQQKVNKTRSQMSVIAHEVADENYNRNFRGDNGGQRITTSLVAATSAILTNLLVIIISISIVVLDLTILLYGILLPVIALIALHPGQGRSKAIGYMSELLTMGIKKIGLSLFLGVYIVIVQAFQLAVGNGVNLGVQLIMVITIGVLGFKNKNKLVDLWSSWKIPGGEPSGLDPQNNANIKGGIASNLWNRAKAGVGGGGSTTATGLASLGNKSSAVNKVKSAIGGSGGKPQVKPGQEDNMFKKDGLKGRAPQTKKPSKDENINAQPAGETPMDNPVHDDSGSGQAPQYKRESEEQASYSEDFNRPEYENVETGYADSSGAGEAPQVGTQDNHSNEEESTPELTPQQRTKIASTKAKVQAKAIKAELKANGHRSHVGIGTVLGAAAKATVVGLATGNTSRAISAGTATVNRKKQQIVEANQQAIKNVSQKHRDRNYELARQQRQSEFEKAQAKRKAEREANMKRNADARAKRYAGNSNQQGKTQQQNPTAQAPQQNSAGQAPQQKPASQEPARKVTYESQAPAPQVSNPATPNVEAPRYGTPVRETPTPQQVSNPVNYVNEVQAPRVEQPRNTTPAPQPKVEQPRNTTPAPQPKVEQPRNTTPAPQPKVEQARNTTPAPQPKVEQARNTTPAPQPKVEQPRNTTPAPQPKVEQPRNTTPAPQPVEKPKYSPKVVPPKAQTPKPPIQPRKSTPAPKPVVKESKPKVSNPKPPAPPVKAPAPKAKVNPPKAQAPQPPLPSRKSLRESGNQTPPAPKPPQPRNR